MSIWWKSMKSAPRDGTLFLAKDRGGARYFIRASCYRDGSFAWASGGFQYWIGHTNLCGWMPIP